MKKISVSLRRRVVISVGLISMLISFVALSWQPAAYDSVFTVFVGSERSELNPLAGLSSDANLIVALLKSRGLRLSMIESLQLTKNLDDLTLAAKFNRTPSTEDTLKALGRCVRIEAKDDLVIVEVKTYERDLSFSIASSLFDGAVKFALERSSRKREQISRHIGDLEKRFNSSLEEKRAIWEEAGAGVVVEELASSAESIKQLESRLKEEKANLDGIEAGLGGPGDTDSLLSREAQRAITSARLKSFESSLDEVRTSAARLPEIAVKDIKIRHEIAVSETLLRLAHTAREEELLRGLAHRIDIQVIDRPERALGPSPRRRSLKSILVGCFLAATTFILLGWISGD